MNTEKNLFLSQRFLKETAKLDKQHRDNIGAILSSIYERLNTGDSSLNEYLQRLKAKKFINCEKRHKFYATDAHRVIYAYGKDIDYFSESESIFILSYVTEHDEQSNVAARLNPESYRYDRHKPESALDSEGLDEDIINYSVDREITYYATRENISKLILSESPKARALLNSEQMKCINRKGPFIIVGNAGSGKTIVSVEIANIVEGEDDSYIYLTITDELVNYVGESAKVYGVEGMENFYSFYRYCLNRLNLKKLNYVDYSRFEHWFNSSCPGEDLEPLDVWTEVRGKIKGYMGESWDRDLRRGPVIDIESYKEIGQEYCRFDELDRKRIYRIAVKYQGWLEKEELYDDNDLARKLIEQVGEDESLKVDTVIVDEVQDLTELQISMVKSLCRDDNFYLIGDPNQIISPTLFSFKRLKKFLYHSGDGEIREFQLKNNYRSAYEIVDYINRVSEKRKRLIAYQKQRYDEPETAMAHKTDRERIFNIKYSIGNLKKIVELYEDLPLNAIIVSDEKSKQELLNVIGCKSDSVYTAIEAKGCEFNQVVCLNLLSHDYEKWEEIFNGNGRKSSSHRYYFNIYYVALTRARNNIFFIEEDERSMNFKFSDDYFTEVEVVDEESILAFKNEDPAEWFQAALSFEKIGDYDRAIKRYERVNLMTQSSDYTPIKRCQAKKLYYQGQSRSDYEEAGNKFMDIKEWGLAEEAFAESGNDIRRMEAVLNNDSKKLKEEEYLQIRRTIECGDVEDLFMKAFIDKYLVERVEEGTLDVQIFNEDIRRILKEGK